MKNIIKIIIILILTVVIAILIFAIKNNYSTDNKTTVATENKEITYCRYESEKICEKRLVNIKLPLNTKTEAEELLKQIRPDAKIEIDSMTGCLYKYMEERDKMCDEKSSSYSEQKCVDWSKRVIETGGIEKQLIKRCWSYTEELPRAHFQTIVGEINADDGHVEESSMDSVSAD